MPPLAPTEPPAPPAEPPAPPPPEPVAPPAPAAPAPPARLPEPSPALTPATEEGQGTAPLGEPRELSLEVGAGVNARLGQASGYTSDGRWGAVYGVGIWFNVAKVTALGLELVHADLGHGSAANGPNLIDADYSLTGAWLGGRFIPWQSEALRFFIGLRVGLSLEHVRAYGLRQSRSPFDRGETFDCSGTHGPAFGLAGGAGLVFRLNSRLDLVTRLDAHAEQLTSDMVGGCAAGTGSATNISLGLGVAYGFDGPSGRSEPFARAPARGQTW